MSDSGSDDDDQSDTVINKIFDDHIGSGIYKRAKEQDIYELFMKGDFPVGCKLKNKTTNDIYPGDVPWDKRIECEKYSVKEWLTTAHFNIPTKIVIASIEKVSKRYNLNKYPHSEFVGRQVIWAQNITWLCFRKKYKASYDLLMGSLKKNLKESIVDQDICQVYEKLSIKGRVELPKDYIPIDFTPLTPTILRKRFDRATAAIHGIYGENKPCISSEEYAYNMVKEIVQLRTEKHGGHHSRMYVMTAEMGNFYIDIKEFFALTYNNYGDIMSTLCSSSWFYRRDYFLPGYDDDNIKNGCMKSIDYSDENVTCDYDVLDDNISYNDSMYDAVIRADGLIKLLQSPPTLDRAKRKQTPLTASEGGTYIHERLSHYLSNAVLQMNKLDPKEFYPITRIGRCDNPFIPLLGKTPDLILVKNPDSFVEYRAAYIEAISDEYKKWSLDVNYNIDILNKEKDIEIIKKKIIKRYGLFEDNAIPITVERLNSIVQKSYRNKFSSIHEDGQLGNLAKKWGGAPLQIHEYKTIQQMGRGIKGPGASTDGELQWMYRPFFCEEEYDNLLQAAKIKDFETLTNIIGDHMRIANKLDKSWIIKNSMKRFGHINSDICATKMIYNSNKNRTAKIKIQSGRSWITVFGPNGVEYVVQCEDTKAPPFYPYWLTDEDRLKCGDRAGTEKRKDFMTILCGQALAFESLNKAVTYCISIVFSMRPTIETQNERKLACMYTVEVDLVKEKIKEMASFLRRTLEMFDQRFRYFPNDILTGPYIHVSMEDVMTAPSVNDRVITGGLHDSNAIHITDIIDDPDKLASEYSKRF